MRLKLAKGRAAKRGREPVTPHAPGRVQTALAASSGSPWVGKNWSGSHVLRPLEPSMPGSRRVTIGRGVLAVRGWPRQLS